MLEHVKDSPTKDRYERVLIAQEDPDSDGINSLEYTLLAANYSLYSILFTILIFLLTYNKNIVVTQPSSFPHFMLYLTHSQNSGKWGWIA